MESLIQKSLKVPQADNRWVAIIRVRGRVNTRRDVEDTLRLLRLHKPNHCVVMRYTPSLRGMLIKAQHRIAWGEIDFDTFRDLLRHRGRVIGDKHLSDKIVKRFTNGKYDSVESLAKALWDGEIKFKDVPWLKPVFRLHPPKKGGYKRSVRKLYSEGGSLGYWGQNINKLIQRML